VIYAVRDGLHAISPSGTRLFRAVDGDGQSPPPVVANGNVYVGSGNALVAVEAGSGKRRWELRLGTRRPQASPAVRADGVVYFLDGGSLYQLDPVFGTGALPNALALPRPFTPSVDGHGWAFLVDPDGPEFPLLATYEGGAFSSSSWALESGHEVVGFSFAPDGTVFAATGSSTAADGQLLAIPPVP
jgi:hypothetical protein